ncbi:MAG: quinone-dependent dihydroorotate dehydrogenase [Verrucomicrobia bacterium]|nr:MAG: quinone-dependent dihydroorotate dehydrogenase [Verrucomicrobiota bacterium]
MNFYKIARSILFKFEAEKAHHLTINGLRAMQLLGITSLMTPRVKNNSIKVMGLTFPNRIGLAAGLDKSGHCINGFGSMGFGFVEIGTITPRPQSGNPQPRLFRLKNHEAIINRMGFNNPGIDKAIDNVTKSAKGYDGIVGINIGKNKITPNEKALEDYMILLRKAYGIADYITINVSSPNTSGLRELQSPEFARGLLSALMKERNNLREDHGKNVPIAVKLDPDMSHEQINLLADLFLELKIDAVIATNTTISRDEVKKHHLASEQGGLSGKPIHSKSNEAISKFYGALNDDIPIIGVGGISSKKDAEEKIAAGAKLLQIYTGLVYQGPSLVKELLSIE